MKHRSYTALYQSEFHTDESVTYIPTSINYCSSVPLAIHYHEVGASLLSYDFLQNFASHIKVLEAG